MRIPRVFFRFHLLLFGALATAGMIVSPGPARAGGMGLVVPAYFYPGTGGTEGYTDGWAQMAASAGKVPITAIFNPDSGPGPSTDPNYVTAMTNLELAGGKVVAYIYTDYGAISLSTVEGQITTYLSQYGNLTSNPIPNLINGFFLDGMSNSPAEVSYYQSLYTFIKGLSSSYQVIGNPGTNTDQSYLSSSPPAASTLMTFENDAQYYAGATPPSWVYDYSSSHFTNTIYDQPTVQGMMADVALAAQRNVGDIYVTDQTINPPTGYLYDRLPSYWNEEVVAVASVPEPGGPALLATGGLLSSLGIAASRWARGRRDRNARRSILLRRPRLRD
jgi:Spherulation-specific family 4